VWVAGIDGCRAGWIAAIRNLDTQVWHFRFARTLAEIVDADEQPGVIAIDMPTGFAECAERGGRACERAARALLVGKTSSVFPTPCRAALDAATHPEAGALNRGSGPAGVGLTRQAFHLFPKMRELDALLRARPSLCRRVFEAHPELAFLRMNGGHPVLPPKRTRPGQVQRRRLLARHGFASAEARWLAYRREAGLRTSDAALDDALDAAAVCRTALLICQREACHLPEHIEHDRHGLPMAIWY
jgi:predicted RNase H-like nuclease